MLRRQPSAMAPVARCTSETPGAFLLTAAHIVTPALKAIQTVPNAICVVGSWIMEMRGRTVYVNESLDLATIPLSGRHVERLVT
jgi:hypothetical protein